VSSKTEDTNAVNKIINGDCLAELKKLSYQCVQTCVTSPPYFGLRDYGVDGQIGLEETLEAYVQQIVQVFREVRRVLRDDGTLWLNLGDSYSAGGRGGGGKQDTNKGSINLGAWKVAGYGQKQLLGVPWKVAFSLQADGWILRQDIIWHKPNPMPESVTDRCTKAHEYIFLLSKSHRYYFDSEAIKEPSKYPNDDRKTRSAISGKRMPTKLVAGVRPGSQTYPFRNRRSVWTVTTKPFKGAHFATFPSDLIEPCILAGAPVAGLVLDPFLGSGTTAMVAKKLGRSYVGIELNSEYLKLAHDRIDGASNQSQLIAAE
jgi:DNA modification methylase